MPRTELVLYQEADGTVPIADWLAALPEKARIKCRVRLGRLAELGHELRRPEADFLRDEIYELRVGLNHVNYRMLYFFHGKEVVVVSHGLTKRKVVPPKEIEDAVKRKKEFEKDPASHTYREP
ncbi:type II toxin-antitoxin system RelE/ParE family toxin [Pirellulales bacterium]|nr:type II toxin-antitoxin system RelE/ParE family toxin [Pirellulales bacterium]